jgi:hypothetical protein
MATTRTSRIDRIYTSYFDTDDSIVHPRGYIPHLPRTKLHDFDRLLDPSRTWAKHLSLVASPPTTILSRSASLHPTGCDVPTDRILPSGWRPTLTYRLVSMTTGAGTNGAPIRICNNGIKTSLARSRRTFKGLRLTDTLPGRGLLHSLLQSPCTAHAQLILTRPNALVPCSLHTPT